MLGTPKAPAKEQPPKSRPPIHARYDATRTDATNERYWVNADRLSPKAANDRDTREKLFTRARYEKKNNGHAKSLVGTVAADTVGTGPRPQVMLFDRPANFARQIEAAWLGWAIDRVVNLTEKVILMDEGEVTDGESFGLLTFNPGISHPVKLDVQVLEPEMICDPAALWSDPLRVDGIEFDAYRNPVRYKVLKEHPGDRTFTAASLAYYVVEAPNMLHWFRPSRAGEARGASGLAAALDKFAQIRRYEKAVLTAAETAAVLSAILKTNLLPGDYEEEGEQNPAPQLWEKNELEPGTMLTAPEGWEPYQMKAEQPTTTFGDFKGDQLDSAGRAVQAPSNVVRGHSRDYNFASGRLDYVIWHRAIRIRRHRMRIRILDPLFRAFIAEASAITDLLPRDLPPIEQWTWNWHWDGFESIDPVKDATADQMEIQTGLATYSEKLAERGKDWEEHFEQIAREKDRAAGLGMTLAYGTGNVAPPPATSPTPAVTDGGGDNAAP